ncbi:MAG: 3-dehydroquinate synthase [Oscillospiraceae bacterium]
MIIPVNADNGCYDIVLERGSLKKAGQLLELDRRVLVVTDEGVPPEYAGCVAGQCKEPVVVTVPRGEGSKSFEQLERLLSAMLEASFTRGDCVVAVGGGVVGDLSGFAASCYMRGIDFYNIPTTLLSQVDSSVGGKTAVNFGGVKNIVGAFYQPKKVIIDPETLKTLERRQLMAGLAEAIKMAATSSAELFELIENSDDLDADLPEIIRRSLCIKRDVVEQDPKENGLRRILNFGHTVGHAVEGFNKGKLLHGECVALGMPPMCSGEALERVTKVLKKYGLPTQIEQSADELMPYLKHDKKMTADSVKVVLVDKIGQFRICDMKPEDILGSLENKT